MVGAPEDFEIIMTEWLGLPPLAAAHGGQIDSLIGWIHIFMLILFVGWGGFIAYALIRFRRSRNPVADYTGVTSHRSTYLEAAVAVVEAVLLLGFAIPLWAARVDRLPPERDALVVQVTAEQFAWNVRYAGPDGVFGKTDIKLIATIPDKTIVLTGALAPARFAESDATFNLGMAFAAAQTLPAGVYIAMNGQVFRGDAVRKDRQQGQFVPR